MRLLNLLCLFLAHAAASQELVVKTIKEAEECNKIAENGDFLRVHYVGRFDDDSGAVFDASRREFDHEEDKDDVDVAGEEETYNFVLGVGHVIQGYEQGVPGMCEGETRTLTVPPHLAYGDQGIEGVIPGGSTLHFTVELVEIVKKNTFNRDEM